MNNSFSQEKNENLDKITTPQQIVQTLKEGNNRFIKGQMLKCNHIEQIHNIQLYQKPSIVSLSCIDSRIPISTIFDQGIGKIFNICIAGNLINKDILGCLELACIIGGAKLIIVIGHNECIAIKSAYHNIIMGNITHTLSKIKPAIDSIKENTINTEISETDFIQKVAYKNVELSIKNIINLSPILQKLSNKKKILITGAMYNIYTGYVEFINFP